MEREVAQATYWCENVYMDCYTCVTTRIIDDYDLYIGRLIWYAYWYVYDKDKVIIEVYIYIYIYIYIMISLLYIVWIL